MYGFPTMYFDQWYQVSGISRINAYALRIARFTHCSLYALLLYALPALRLKLEVGGVLNSPALALQLAKQECRVFVSQFCVVGRCSS